MSEPIKYQTASIGKRLLAIFYDLLIILFFTFIATFIIQQVIIQLQLVPLEQIQINQQGDKISMIPEDSIVTHFLRALSLLVSFAYFTYYWTTRGQTLGMSVWKIKAISNQKSVSKPNDNSNPSFSQAALRYVSALLGVGLLWALFNKEHRALQDTLSNTTLIKVVS